MDDRERGVDDAARKGLKKEGRGSGVGLTSTVCIEPRSVSSQQLAQTPLTAAPIALVLAPFPPPLPPSLPAAYVR